MKGNSFEQLIMEGIQGLPSETLAEITDFIYFVRKRVFNPTAYEEDLQELSLRAELKKLSRDEGIHLEKEFENYEQLFPRK